MMNARFLSRIAQSEERWELSGDQLLIDLDLSIENLPPGTRLRVGSAVIEVSKKPHTGCAKFAARFGQDALRFVSTPEGRALRLRGANAKVVQSGAIRVGDEAVKLPPGGVTAGHFRSELERLPTLAAVYALPSQYHLGSRMAAREA